MTEERAREALLAQGFEAPGPKLVEMVADAIVRIGEQLPAGERRFRFSGAELLEDTPELINRTHGPLRDPDAELLPVVLDVLSKARDYVYHEE